MRVFGVQLILSTAEDGLWWDHDVHWDDHRGPQLHQDGGKPGWGIAIKLRGGDVARPILHPRHWLKRTKPNVWFDTSPGVRWFTLRFRLPLPILPFISIALGNLGFYAGFKDFPVHHAQYHAWLPPEAIGDDSTALTPSATMRLTRIK